MPEITKTDAGRPFVVPAYIWFVLFALAVFVYFYGLTIPFVGPDESRYAQVAREMLESGDWITPTLAGHHWFEKPALLYWLQVLSYQMFGINEFAARFGPALFGLGTVFSLWVLGRSTVGVERPDRVQFANTLALIAASTLGIMVFARGASFDIIVTFPLTAALVSFFIFDQARSDEGGRRYVSLILFYVFIGIALLAKGLIGILLPLAIVGLYHIVQRRLPSRTFLVSLIWGIGLALAIAAVWYWPMYQHYGNEFIDEFILQHHFQRFTSNKYKHPQPFYFFLWVLPLMTLPWMPFFLAGLRKAASTVITSINRAENGGKFNDLTIFAVCWLSIPLAFFSLSGSKLPGYILPAVPSAIVIAGVFLFERCGVSKRWLNAILSIAVATLIGAVLLLTFIVPGYADRDTVKGLMIAADERGFSTSRVLTLHTISHNAEFYAGPRLVRGEDGEQSYRSEVSEVVSEVRNSGRPVLVIVPLIYVEQLLSAKDLTGEMIKDNGELAIVAASLK